jgi:spermidine synthase
MIPWTKLGSARAPDGMELSLWKRDDEIVVRAGVAVLMSTRQHGSEELLAEHGCEGLGPGARVLIGGLGLGYTLRAVLNLLPKKVEVVVAELIPEIVDWLRGPVGAGALLDDRRVTVDLRDVAAVIRSSADRFDAILLDVDNSPDSLVQPANARLYGPDGLAEAVRALRPGGRYAVWSAGDDVAFTKRLGRAGLDARAIHVRATKEKGSRHVIFLGTKRAR